VTDLGHTVFCTGHAVWNDTQVVGEVVPSGQMVCQSAMHMVGFAGHVVIA